MDPNPNPFKPDDRVVRGLANLRVPTFPPGYAERLSKSMRSVKWPAGSDRGLQQALEQLQRSTAGLGQTLTKPLATSDERVTPRIMPRQASSSDIKGLADVMADQTAVIVALHGNLRDWAQSSDNRSRWNLCFSLLAAAGAVVALFEVLLR